MNVNGIQQTVSLTTFAWTCKFCHRGFESKTLGENPPKELVCNDCADAYNSKAFQTYRLDDVGERVARKVGNKSDCRMEQRETLARWQQLAMNGDLQTRLRYTAMFTLANRIRTGMESSPAPKQNRGDW